MIMKKYVFSITALALIGFLLVSVSLHAQLPCKVLVGYYQTSWGTDIRLKDVNSNYNVICLSFLEANGGDGNTTNNSVNNLNFYARQNTQLKADIPVVQALGKKVLMSIGGASGSFKLNSATEVTTFVNKVKAVISEYGVDGIDIDLEQAIYLNQAGTISNPSDHITNLISGINQLLTWYQTTYSKKMILTMVPETAYVTGGLSPYQTNIYGAAYLPVIEALRNDLDLLMVQLYNATENFGLDGVVYKEGTADYIVSQTEAIIEGFTCVSGRGVYSGLPESKVAVTLPAGAGSGYVAPATVKAAIDYLRGTGSKPGSYTLRKAGGYPNLRGMGTWSINIDYDGGYTYASNYASIFSCPLSSATSAKEQSGLSVYPNPAQQEITIEKKASPDQELQIVNAVGEVLYQQKLIKSVTTINISTLPTGLYVVKIGDAAQKIIIE
jgi:chitinase